MSGPPDESAHQFKPEPDVCASELSEMGPKSKKPGKTDSGTSLPYRSHVSSLRSPRWIVDWLDRITLSAIQTQAGPAES